MLFTWRQVLLAAAALLALTDGRGAAAQHSAISNTQADGAMRVAQQRTAANQQTEQQQRAAVDVKGPALAPPAPPATPAAPGAAPAASPANAPAQAPTAGVQSAFPGMVGSTGGTFTPSTSAAAAFPGREPTVRHYLGHQAPHSALKNFCGGVALQHACHHAILRP